MAVSLPDVPITGTPITSTWGLDVRSYLAATAPGVAQAAGDVFVATAANEIKRVPIGSAGRALLSTGSDVEWGQRGMKRTTGTGRRVSSWVTVTPGSGSYGTAVELIASMGEDAEIVAIVVSGSSSGTLSSISAMILEGASLATNRGEAALGQASFGTNGPMFSRADLAVPIKVASGTRVGVALNANATSPTVSVAIEYVYDTDLEDF